MSVFDEHSEKIAESFRRYLAMNKAGVNNRWYTPDVVERVGGFASRTFEEIIERAPRTSYIVFPGERTSDLYATRRQKVTEEFYVLAARRFDSDTDQFSLGNALVDAHWADGALTLIGAVGADPCYIRCVLEDPNGTLSAGTVTLTGLDQNGNALSLSWTPSTDGDDQRLYGPGFTLAASITGASIAGTVGGDAATRLKIGARVDRITLQNRLEADVEGTIRDGWASAALLADVDQVEEVVVVETDKRLYTPGWAVVNVLTKVMYTQQVGCP